MSTCQASELYITVQYSTLYILPTCPAGGQYSIYIAYLSRRRVVQYSTVHYINCLPTQQLGSTVQYAVQYIYYLPAKQVGSTVQYAVQYIYYLPAKQVGSTVQYAVQYISQVENFPAVGVPP